LNLAKPKGYAVTSTRNRTIGHLSCKNACDITTAMY
jgi:hypothetical protein